MSRTIYAFKKHKHKDSKYDGKPYIEIDMFSVDDANEIFYYRTYAVEGYRNYKRWQRVIRAMGDGAVQIRVDDIKTKATDGELINADVAFGKNFEIVRSMPWEELASEVEYGIENGLFKNPYTEKPSAPLPSHAKQFFQEA